MQRLMCLAGWGQRRMAFSALAECVTGQVELTLASVHELFAEHDAAEQDDEESFPPAGVSLYARELVKRLESAEPTALLGVSMGGMVCLEAAALSPEKVKTVILVSSTAIFSGEPEACAESAWFTPRAQLRAMSLGLLNRREETLARFFQDAYGKPLEAAPVQAAMAEAAAVETRALMHGLRYLSGADLRNGLSAINKRVLVIHGANDRIIQPAAACYLADTLSQAALLMLPQGEHMLCSQFAARLAVETMGFLCK